MGTEQFEKNVKMLAKKAGEITRDESDAHDAEKILRLFDSETVDLIKTFVDCCEKISKKIDGL